MFGTRISDEPKLQGPFLRENTVIDVFMMLYTPLPGTYLGETYQIVIARPFQLVSRMIVIIVARINDD